MVRLRSLLPGRARHWKTGERWVSRDGPPVLADAVLPLKLDLNAADNSGSWRHPSVAGGTKLGPTQPRCEDLHHWPLCFWAKVHPAEPGLLLVVSSSEPQNWINPFGHWSTCFHLIVLFEFMYLTPSSRSSEPQDRLDVDHLGPQGDPPSFFLLHLCVPHPGGFTLNSQVRKTVSSLLRPLHR